MSSDSAITAALIAVSPATTDNFSEWSWTVQANFIAGGVWNPIFQKDAQGLYPQEPAPANPAAPTAAETLAITAFRAARTKAANWILLAAGAANRDLTEPHQAASDATAMWDALVTRFERQDPGARFRTMFRLLQTIKTPGQVWSEYCVKLDNIGHRLLGLTPLNFDRIRFVAELKLFALLSSFTSSDPARNALVMDPNLSWENARNAVERLHSTLPSGTAPDSANVAESSAAAATKPTCKFCGYTGHFISECRIAMGYSCLFHRERGEGIRRDPKGVLITGSTSGSSSRPSNRRPPRRQNERARFTEEFPEEEEETAGNASLSSPLTRTTTDAWTADSGASKHMSFRKDWIRNLRSDRRPIRLADDTVVWSEGVGDVLFSPIINGAKRPEIFLKYVLYVPKLRSNLISVPFLTKYRGIDVNFRANRVEFLKQNSLILTASISDHNLPILNGITIPIESAGSAFTSNVAAPLSIWHNRFAHRHYAVLQKLKTSKAVSDFKVIGNDKPCVCEACIEGKSHRAPHSAPAKRASRPLERVSSDVKGPISTHSRRGHRYWISFVDQYSGFTSVYFIREKSEALDCIKRYISWAENKTGLKVLNFRDDGGGEYTPNDLRTFLMEKGIHHETTIRDSPEQNGQAERFNQTLQQGITTLLSKAHLPPSLWTDAASTFVHVNNRTPSESRDFKSPHELFLGQTPSVKHLRTWGCLAYVHLQKNQRQGTFGPRAKRCIFLRYAEEAKGWVFWDTEKRSEFVSDSAEFFEDIFPGTLTRKIPKIDQSSPQIQPYFDDEPTLSIPEPVPITTIPIPAHHPNPADIPLPASPNLTETNAILNPTGQEPNPLSLSPPLPLPEAQQEPATEPESPRLIVTVPGSVQRDQTENEQPIRPIRLSRELRNLQDNTHFESRQEPTSRLRRTRARETANHVSESTTPPISLHTTIFNRNISNSVLSPFSSPDTDIIVPIQSAVDLALNISTSIEPKSLAEASRRPDGDKYIEAAIKEIEAHIENGTWRVTQLPEGRKAIGCRWVFKIKRDTDGKVERYKARLVAKGFAQQQGVDFTDTFAPTARFAALRAIIAKAAQEDWLLHSVDISTAFLNGNIDAEIFMEVPEGLHVDSPHGQKWVLQLLKGLYGIKQGPRIWAKKLHSVLTEMGFKRLECDHSVFIYDRNGTQVIVPVHVDDLIIASKSLKVIEEFVSQLSLRFKLRDQGPIGSFLGVKLERDYKNNTISLSQPAYIDSVIKEFLNIDPSSPFNPVSTPMLENQRLSRLHCPQTDEERSAMAKFPYKAVVGKLLWLAIATRPDIAYAVSVLCRFLADPGKAHWAAVKHLLRYLRGTRDLKLVYSQSQTPNGFITYSDADHGGDASTGRSTGGFVTLIANGAVHWSSRLHKQVSLSSTEAEYVAASNAGQEIMWLRYFFEELRDPVKTASPLLMDSNSAIQVAKNPEHQSTMKHVHRHYHWLREHVERNNIEIKHVPGSENVADIFTKPLGRIKFVRFREMLGLR
jgi:hypothetical protein